MSASAGVYALRRLRRGWRSGELLVLTLALAVAVAAVGAVDLFTERVRAALAQQTGETLGGDLLYSARQALPDALRSQIDASGVRSLDVVQFPSVVFSDAASELASVKAVADGYPLRGELRTAPDLFAPEQRAAGVPAPGQAWADTRLWQALRLQPGQRVRLGAIEVEIAAVITHEPDRGTGFTDLAPRLLINRADAQASGLLGPGSRAQYSLLVAGARDAVAALAAQPLPEGVRRFSPQDARPEIRSALQRAGRFLDVAILAATLLAAAAVALSARQYGDRLKDEIALLKCLGARQGFLARAMVAQLAVLALAGCGAGGAVAYLAQGALAGLLGSLLQLELPAAPLWPLASAAALGFLMLLGFAAPPMLDARRTPPLRVFQRATVAGGLSHGVWLAAVASAAGLLWLATGDPKLAGTVLVGAGASLLVLALLAALLVRMLAPLRSRVGVSWRFGLGNVARRKRATIVQVTALGLALLALLLVSVVRQDLLRTWQNRLPPETPNQFLINIQQAQVEPLRAFFAERGQPDIRFWPMARGRLVALNDEPVTVDSFDDPETQRWINRDFNLSWTATLNPDNRIVEGQWWGEAGRGEPLLSADEYAIERLNLKLGDRMTLDFAGERISFTVSNFRTVEWDSFRPNFFLLAPPGAVPDTVPRQYLTSFYLPQAQRALLRDLVARFPNVTALDIGALMNQVRGIVDRIVAALEFIFLFTLAAGLTVLLAAIEGTRAERVRETALLRALGARSTLIARGLVAEYAVLGALAGLVAAVAAQTVAWVLAAQVFEIPYGPRPSLWLIGALSGAALVAGLGWLSLRRVLRTPPRLVLQQGM